MASPVGIPALLLTLLLGMGAATSVAAGENWAVRPAYESKVSNTQLVITDNHNDKHQLYTSSVAVLIINGAYQSGAWREVSSQGQTSETHLRTALEQRGYRVLVWRNLTADQMRGALDDVERYLGYDKNGRIFFYYFGHGTVIGTDGDGSIQRGFLVPIDAPDPIKDEQAFYQSAVPIGRIDSLARNMTTKHVFVALEACQAGSLFESSLGEVEKTNPQGYLFSRKLQEPSRQFLTAGDAHQDVPATNLFTGVLEEALDKADLNGDGYVTGSELMQYVTLNVPQRLPTNKLTPEQGSTGDGDMIIGPVKGRAPKSVALGPDETGEHRVQLTSMVSGTISKVLVSPGTDVVIDQPLFQLDSRDAQAKVRSAKAKADEINASLALARKSLSTTRAEIKNGLKTQEAADDTASRIKALLAQAESASSSLKEAENQLDATTRTAPVCGRVVDLVKARGDTVESGATILTIDTTPCLPRVGTTSANRAAPAAAPRVATLAQPAVQKPRALRDPSIPTTTLFSNFSAPSLKDRVKARCIAAQAFEQKYNADIAKLTADGPGADYASAKAKMDGRRLEEQSEFNARYLPELRDLHYELLNRLDLGYPNAPQDLTVDGQVTYIQGVLRGDRPIGEFCDYLTALAARLPR